MPGPRIALIHALPDSVEPANAAYEVRILPPNRVRIQGKLIGLVRKY